MLGPTRIPALRRAVALALACSAPAVLASPAHAAPPTAAPSPGRTPAATRTGVRPASPRPAAAHATPGQPKILRVSLSSYELSPGEHVTGEVVTTPDVARVQARIVGQRVDLPRSSRGHFPFAFTVPGLIPFFMKGTYTVEFVASAHGEQDARTLSFHVR